MFPAMDPIPLPAPVWLFKLLHVVTLSLHFVAMQALVGGLLFASIATLVGRARGRAPLLDASGAVAFRLPILMTYVINFGVPPLLFAQVLYGRALYTSSVLIGAWWISVILLLMTAYTLLYVMVRLANERRGWGWVGLVALAFVLGVGFIYTSNMTLMLRPQVWSELYRADALGRHLNAGDPTVMPRWVFMMVGSLTAGGVGMMLVGMKKFLTADAATVLRQWGGRLAAAGLLVQVLAGAWVLQSQPEAVRAALGENSLFGACLIAWVVTAVGVAVVALVAQARAANWTLASLAGLLVVLNVMAMTMARDILRDVTLAGFGFDVWDRAIATNWIVVGAFLVLFVGGLGVVFWLSRVVAQTQGQEERYA
ncbi:MAG: hypothetical protein KF858_02955 [Candidatus Sumerlaeia bacterium]|nr:hypothetical protein [Candidatus Sumerlaeia bacterium]